ncbi:MAG: type IV pili methyl-accepting chemotaxis transducer N-terminal domain-containing protein [Sulfitobacter sp.]
MNNPPKMERRRLFTAMVPVALATAGVLAVSPTHANAAVDVSHKISIAGDMRMFTQRMALSAAFVMLDIEKEHYLDVLTDEFHEFQADIDLLRNGDPQFEMEPEQNKLVLEAINTVEFGWSFLGPALKEIVDTKTINDAQFTKIEKINTQVMSLADSLVHRILVEYDSLPVDLAYQIDIVGAQRMLSQKMIKEAILVALEFEVEAHHEMLLGSMSLFRFGLDKLAGKMAHNEHMLPAFTGEMAEQLQQAEHYWSELHPVLEKLDQTHEMTHEDALLLSKEADELLAVFDAMTAVLISAAEQV